jgi:hypothetical protein
VSQQQGGDSNLTFSSQFGTIAVNSLPVVSGPGLGGPAGNFAAPVYEPAPYAPAPVQQTQDRLATDDIVGLIEKLARLRDAGALTEAEFLAKKNELLSRI